MTQSTNEATKQVVRILRKSCDGDQELVKFVTDSIREALVALEADDILYTHDQLELLKVRLMNGFKPYAKRTLVELVDQIRKDEEDILDEASHDLHPIDYSLADIVVCTLRQISSVLQEAGHEIVPARIEEIVRTSPSLR